MVFYVCVRALTQSGISLCLCEWMCVFVLLP